MSTFCTSPVITDDDGYDLLDRLAILIMTADHYCINSGHLLGEFAMRRRHLLRLGYTVVEVRRFLGKGFSSQFTVHCKQAYVHFIVGNEIKNEGKKKVWTMWQTECIDFVWQTQCVLTSCAWQTQCVDFLWKTVDLRWQIQSVDIFKKMSVLTSCE